MDDFMDFELEESEIQGRKEVVLSEDQKRKLKEAVKRMEENMVRPQTIAGKNFEGAGFSSKPEVILYKDFEVGVPMTINVELTNRSLGFNSFKLLPLDDEIIDFFEIGYRPCGRIPAGICTNMTLKFTPIVNKSYISHLRLLSETGLVLVPIHCLKKECIIELESEILNFGDVILGQEEVKPLNYENKGALTCRYSFVDEAKNNLTQLQETYALEDKVDPIRDEFKTYEDYIERKVIVDKEKYFQDKNNTLKYFLKQMSYPEYGNAGSYSKGHINFKLSAKYLGQYSVPLLMKLEYKDATEYKHLIVNFNVIDLPIYSEKKIYQLDYITEENNFREKIILTNTSNISYKIQIYQHKELNDFIEINPNLGYVQANSSFEVWLKLKTKAHIRNLNHWFKTGNEHEFNLPFKIVVTNITVPLVVIINFFLTKDKMSLSKKFFNFNKLYCEESNKIQFTMENKSLHPQKYGFIMLPKELTLKNNIDIILPGEKVFVDCMFKTLDNYLGHREGDFFCRVVTNDIAIQNIKLNYHVEVVATELQIKPKMISYECLAEDERKQQVLTLRNNTADKAICEWLLPPFCISGITIMPKVFELEPDSVITCVLQYESKFRPYNAYTMEEIEKELISNGGQNIVQVEGGEAEFDTTLPKGFNPLLEEKVKKEIETALSLADGGGKDAKKKDKKPEEKKKPPEGKKDKKQLEEEERKRKEEEERRLQEIEEAKAQKLASFNREKELKLFAADIKNFNADEQNLASQHSKFTIPLYYKKLKEDANFENLEIKKTFIEVNTTCIQRRLEFEKTELDFGEVSMKTRKTMTINLTNKSNTAMDVKMKPLIISNCFNVVNSTREIAPGGTFSFLVEFFPQKDLPYFDKFIVFTGDTLCSVQLKGKGVQPEVAVNVQDGIFFIGNSMNNNYLEKTFDIINKSTFNIFFEIKTLSSGKKNKTGIKPFTYIPYKGEIAGNETQTIKVVFCGDHQEINTFYELILIDVANQRKPNYIYVSAASWNRQLYFREFVPSRFYSEQELPKYLEQDYFSETINVNGSKSDKIVLEFVKYSENLSKDDLEKTQKRKMIIGNCRLNDQKAEKNGTYEINIPKDDPYFTCDNVKGTVNAGQEVTVNFNFKKPSIDPLLKDIACLAGVGMWVTTKVELKIGGGFVLPGAPDAQSLEILLKAFIDQI